MVEKRQKEKGQAREEREREREREREERKREGLARDRICRLAFIIVGESTSGAVITSPSTAAVPR